LLGCPIVILSYCIVFYLLQMNYSNQRLFLICRCTNYLKLSLNIFNLCYQLQVEWTCLWVAQNLALDFIMYNSSCQHFCFDSLLTCSTCLNHLQTYIEFKFSNVVELHDHARLGVTNTRWKHTKPLENYNHTYNISSIKFFSNVWTSHFGLFLFVLSIFD
jgi:hypothetical protein